MTDQVYEAFQEEYDTQQENGFNTTEVDGMKALFSVTVLVISIIRRQ